MAIFVFLREDNTIQCVQQFEKHITKEWVSEQYDITPVLLVEINSFDDVPTNKEGSVIKYNGSEFYYEEIVEPGYVPTEQELIQAELLLNQIDIITKQNEQDEVLATILLNQVEV